MIFKRFESEGLSHYSYYIGYGQKAAAIDPRRDCGIYIDVILGGFSGWTSTSCPIKT